jgi:hypothetical protein
MKAMRFAPLAVLLPLLLGAAVLTLWLITTVFATFEPEPSVELSDYNAGVNADVTDTFSVPAGDVNYDIEVLYTPPEWSVASDADTAGVAEVGQIDIAQTLGLAVDPAAPCNVVLARSFDLLNCTTQGPGFITTGDLLAGTWNGYQPVCPGGNERQVCQYPDFLDDLFPVRPRARYCSHAVITAGIESAINVLVFDPGTDLGNGIPNDPDWGYPTVTVLNDTGVDRPAQPGILTDFCTPTTRGTTIFGQVDSIPVRTNPQYGGVYTFRSWSRGLPDADGDGIENRLDTCPYDPNDGDPRIVMDGDADRDGLDAACDPSGWTIDEDGDSYVNRADNCPLVPNGLAPGQTNQADADGDDIGDVCDLDPAVVDGVQPDFTAEFDVNIIGPPPPTATPEPTPTPPPPSPIDFGMTNLLAAPQSFANPWPSGVKLAVFAATADNAGTQPSPASLSLQLIRMNLTCPAPLVLPISPYSLTLDPGDQALRAWLVIFRRCGDPSPPVDYVAAATVAAPGDGNLRNNTVTSTIDVKQRRWWGR